MTITLAHYFGDKQRPIEHEANANLLLYVCVNPFLDECHKRGHYDYQIDPDTGTQISGSKGGSGDGGYRLQNSKTGAPGSSHKEANGVDVSDSVRKLAAFCVTGEGKQLLEKYGLWMEDPRWTPVWCHFQRIPPRSGHRIYIPSTSAPLAQALPGQKPLPYIVRPV